MTITGCFVFPTVKHARFRTKSEGYEIDKEKKLSPLRYTTCPHQQGKELVYPRNGPPNESILELIFKKRD